MQTKLTSGRAWSLAAALTGAVLLAIDLDPRWVAFLLTICDRHPWGGVPLVGLTVGLPIALLRSAYGFWKSPPGTHPFLAVPATELKTYFRTAAEAGVMARTGRVSEGYLHLSTALHRVETLRENGEPWAHNLTQRYRKLLERYVSRHGMG